MKKIIILALLALWGLGIAPAVYAHCEIPCGIYDDQMRVSLIEEHITTIEKSMKQIQELSSQETKNYNQIVRWVQNKEDHANKIQDIVTQYFMNQRIKPAEANDEAAYQKYITELSLLHRMLVSAMKAKQTTDLKHTNDLSKWVLAFRASYFVPHEHDAKPEPVKPVVK